MSYQFAGCSFNTQSELLNAIAEEFMTAGGANKPHTILNDMLFIDTTDAEFARECVKMWELDALLVDLCTDEETDVTQLGEWDITESDIATAIGQYRQRVRDEATKEDAE